MQNENIENLLSPVGIPLAYRRFSPYKNRPVPSPPYMIYDVVRETAYGADDLNLVKKLNVLVELYSVNKDKTHETAIENCLKHHEWDKDEDYIESEKLYVASYEFELIEKSKE